MRFVVVVTIVMRPVPVIVAVAVAMMIVAAAQEPRAGDVDGQAEAGDRNHFGEVNRQRRKKAGDRFVTYQHAYL